MPLEGIEIFHHSPLRENSGLIQFIDRDKGKEFTIVVGTKIYSLHFRLEDLRN